jgi:hypothetical protein
MARLEELQQLWQSQPQPPAAAVDSRGMRLALGGFARRQNLIHSVKAVLLVWLVWLPLAWVGLSALTVAGAAILLGGALAVLITDWRSQLGIARLDFTKPSAGFVDSVLERLRDPNALFRRRFWQHVIPLSAGINLLFATHWAMAPPRSRIAAHLAVTLAPLAGYALGLKIRRMRYTAAYRPIIERLEAMKKALEEQPQ